MKPRIFIFFIAALLCAATYAQEPMLDVALPAGTSSTLVSHHGYTVSFNDDARIPNYVAYVLRPEDITTEGVSRNGEEFVADPDIPGCPETQEYNRSNFPKDFASDRGHMMPAADCKTSEVRMSESFYLSNVCPQDHDLNEGTWCDLEKQVRFWCKHWYKTDLVVICGPVFGADSRKSKTGIVIPDGFFKVICREDAKEGWTAISFVFLNSPETESYKMFRTSVDEVERLTGFDFFKCLPADKEKAMEKDMDKVWKL